MADVQQQFIDFHDTIRRADDETKREKRDMLVEELRDRLPDSRPAFKEFNQGSYAMHTNIVPIHTDDDIDVGLRFQDTVENLGCPVRLKEDVRDALNHANRTINIKRPCVTVQYLKNGEPDYHVDLAVYGIKNTNEHLDLAIGKSGSPQVNRTWSEEDTLGVIKTIKDAQPKDSEERKQFRRCIRNLKRWRDEQYSRDDGPVSIALTAAAKHWFVPEVQLISGKPNDLTAMYNWVTRMINEFHGERLTITHVGWPYNDLLSSMTDAAQSRFKNNLIDLQHELHAADSDPDPHSACTGLRDNAFGSDFPVPEKGDTGKRVVAPVITTGNSA